MSFISKKVPYPLIDNEAVSYLSNLQQAQSNNAIAIERLNKLYSINIENTEKSVRESKNNKKK